MNSPTSRPWSCGSPQNTGSLALAATSLETGIDFWVLFCSGPCWPNRYTPTQTAIQLSMIVVITSLVPVVAFRRPAIPAHAAPAAQAATSASSAWGTCGTCANDDPTQTAAIAPVWYLPWPPMLNIPQQNANATASPVRISGVVASSVCWRLIAAVERSLVHGKNQFRPVPSKIALYVDSGLWPVSSTTKPPTTKARSTVI